MQSLRESFVIKIQLSCQLVPMVFKAYGIQLITVSPTNHKSLQAEHGIKSLSSILMKHLSGLGDDGISTLDQPC